MPEAVIVAAARSPIGRANKGSLKDLRPDDLTAHDRPGRARQGARARPARRSTTSTSAAACPAASSGYNMARVVNVLLGLDDVPGATITRYCSSSRADHPDGLPRDQGRRGRRVRLRRRRDRVPVRQGHLRPLARHPQPALRRRQGPHRRAGRRAASVWHDPREDGAAPRRLHRDGPDRREPRPAARPRPARSSTSSASAVAEPRREGDRRRLLGARDHPGHHARRHRGQRRRRPARRRHLRGGRRSSSRSSAPTAWSPPATAARSTTAPPRSSSCPTPRPPSSASPRWPGSSSTGVTGLSPEIMGLGPVEATKQALAHAGMTHRRHRPGRDQRGVRRAGRAVVPGPRHRPRPAQRQRRRDRGRPPVRHDRRPAAEHDAQLAGLARQDDRPDHHVRRRRPGHGDDPRAALLSRPGSGDRGPTCLAGAIHSTCRARPTDPLARRRPAALVARAGHGHHPAPRPARRRPAPRPSTSRWRSTRSWSGSPSGRRPACGWPSSPTRWPTAAAGSPTRSPGWRRPAWSQRSSSPEDGRGIVCATDRQGLRPARAMAAPTHVAGVRDHLVDLASREDFAALGRVMNAVADQPGRRPPRDGDPA